MALQQFVKQAGNTQSRPKTAVPEEPVQSHVSKASLQTAMKAATISSTPSVHNDTVSPQLQGRVSLTAEERDTLSSLAAVQIRYNRPAEAVPYLMMLRKTDKEDTKSARLLALALMKLGNWEQAEIILNEIHADENEEDTSENPVFAFYRSVVAFKQHKLSIARQWLQRFRSLVTGGAS